MRKVKIGDKEFDGGVFLAPMAGVSDVTFRVICREMKCSLAYTEMVSAKALFYGSEKTEDLFYIDPKEKETAVQIFGSEPQIMAEIAERISVLPRVALIDINMGCPAPKIVKNGEGSAIMKTPELAGKIVNAVSKASKVPVTVKMRKGWDDDNINVLEVASICEENGASAVAIHGRTRKQMYSGKADWSVIKDVKSILDIPVIGNGDIVTPEDAKNMIEYTGCDAVMIGRGAEGNPWIFNRTYEYLMTGELIPEPTDSEKIELALRHAKMLIEHKGDKVGTMEARKHIAWYIKGIKHSAAVRDLINRTENHEDVEKILNDYKKMN